MPIEPAPDAEILTPSPDMFPPSLIDRPSTSATEPTPIFVAPWLSAGFVPLDQTVVTKIGPDDEGQQIVPVIASMGDLVSILELPSGVRLTLAWGDADHFKLAIAAELRRQTGSNERTFIGWPLAVLIETGEVRSLDPATKQPLMDAPLEQFRRETRVALVGVEIAHVSTVPTLHQRHSSYWSLLVDPADQGNFSTIQEPDLRLLSFDPFVVEPESVKCPQLVDRAHYAIPETAGLSDLRLCGADLELSPHLIPAKAAADTTDTSGESAGLPAAEEEGDADDG